MDQSTIFAIGWSLVWRTRNGSSALVLDADVVVGCAGAEAIDGGQDGLALRQFVRIVDLFAVNFSEASQRVFGTRGKGEFYGGFRAGGLHYPSM